VGAILTGVIADLVSLNAAILFVGIVTMLSAVVIGVRMRAENEGIEHWAKSNVDSA
jgi:hypothetical protein